MFVYLTEKITQTVSVTKTAVEIVENEVKLKLTIVDTPGFGGALNNSKRYLKWCLSKLSHYTFVNTDIL